MGDLLTTRFVVPGDAERSAPTPSTSAAVEDALSSMVLLVQAVRMRPELVDDPRWRARYTRCARRLDSAQSAWYKECSLKYEDGEE